MLQLLQMSEFEDENEFWLDPEDENPWEKITRPGFYHIPLGEIDTGKPIAIIDEILNMPGVETSLDEDGRMWAHVNILNLPKKN